MTAGTPYYTYNPLPDYEHGKPVISEKQGPWRSSGVECSILWEENTVLILLKLGWLYLCNSYAYPHPPELKMSDTLSS